MQNLWLKLYVRHLQSHAEGNAIRKQIIDTYTLKVGPAGAMQTLMTSALADTSENLSTNSITNIFTNLGNIVSGLQTSVSQTSLSDFPMSKLQAFIFPGGRTFAFSNFNFSDHGDLTAAINYVDPTMINGLGPVGGGGGGASISGKGAAAISASRMATSSMTNKLRQQGLLFCSSAEPRRQAISALQDRLRQQGLLFC